MKYLHLTLDFIPYRNKPSIVTTWSTLFILLAFSTTLKVVISVGEKRGCRSYSALSAHESIDKADYTHWNRQVASIISKPQPIFQPRFGKLKFYTLPNQ
jgi:hypothetical protein